jgi:glucokinase
MTVIGIDLGGTQMRGSRIKDKTPSGVLAEKVSAAGTEEEVLQELFHLTDRLVNDEVRAMGIGVPSVVDVEEGIVYDVQNIPSWKKVPLKKLMEDRYHIPVLVNNDANCFALGEKYFGQGKESHSFVGLTIGTGLGAGIVIHDRLYAGPNCGAGEFGMVDYLDRYYEYYASGQFFKNCYETAGEEIFRQAQAGDERALHILEEFGVHLGNAVKMILYTYDPQMIILGGSIREAYPYFQKTLWERINTFAYPNSLKNFSIRISDLKHSGILGAAALCYEGR